MCLRNDCAIAASDIEPEGVALVDIGELFIATAVAADGAASPIEADSDSAEGRGVLARCVDERADRALATVGLAGPLETVEAEGVDGDDPVPGSLAAAVPLPHMMAAPIPKAPIPKAPIPGAPIPQVGSRALTRLA